MVNDWNDKSNLVIFRKLNAPSSISLISLQLKSRHSSDGRLLNVNLPISSKSRQYAGLKFLIYPDHQTHSSQSSPRNYSLELVDVNWAQQIQPPKSWFYYKQAIGFLIWEILKTIAMAKKLLKKPMSKSLNCFEGGRWKCNLSDLLKVTRSFDVI